MRDAFRSRALLALVLPLCACVHTDLPPPNVVPAGESVARPEDLAGEYCWYGLERHVRTFRRGPEAIAFFDVTDLATPTRVSVRVTPEMLFFTHQRPDGTVREQVFDLVATKATWDRGSYVAILPVDWGISATGLFHDAVLGFWSTSREARVTKLLDGRLVLSDSLTRKGMTQDNPNPLSINVHRKQDVVTVILPPAPPKGCIDPAAVERQPWFEPGLDLRDPACASDLEAQIASILQEKGEEPQLAQDIAARTVSELPPGTQRFDVSSPSERGFEFRIASRRSGCALRLQFFWRKVKRVSASGRLTGPASGAISFVSRPLAACVCKD